MCCKNQGKLKPLWKCKLLFTFLEPLWWFSGKKPAGQCMRHGFNLWVRKILGEGNDNPLQDSCLGKPIDRGA